MAYPIKICPSILSANFGRFAADASALVAGGADELHVDFMDGHFVPNLTFGPQLVRDLSASVAARYDIHLMVDHADTYVEELARAGASMLTVHIEATPHIDRLVHQVKDAGLRVGMAINPGSPVQRGMWVLGLLDRVLVMTVNPGFGGQSFIPLMTDKIAELARLREERGFAYEIAVDGGIDEASAALVARAGATALVSGSWLFKHPGGLADGIALLRRAAEGASA